jgi:hypothetical protein
LGEKGAREEERLLREGQVARAGLLVLSWAIKKRVLLLI